MKIRRCVLILLWILSLLSISFYGGAISYGFFFGVTLVPVISLLYLGMVYWRFKLYQELESRNMVCGQPVPYFFVLQNDDYFAFSGVSVKLFSSFSYVEELPDDIEYELLPSDHFTYRTKLVCKYRGEYEVGVKEIVVTDFFRLFRIHYAVPGTIRALVMPKVVRVSELGSIGDIAAFVQRESFLADTEPDAVVRDYTEGDALKQIHWKATAREQKLKVRNRIGEEKKGITLFCDTERYSEDNRIYLPLENKILETLLALGIFFAEREMAFSVCYGQNGIVCSQVEGMKDFDHFYHGVSGIAFGEERADEILYQLMWQSELRNSKVILCVLHEISDRMMELTGQLAESGVIVVVYAVTDRNMDHYIKQSSQRRRIIVIPPNAELEGRL